MATSSEITDIIKAQIRRFEGQAESADVGTVVEVGDGIARVHGLAGCMASELLDFGHDVFGLAFNLEEDTVSAISSSATGRPARPRSRSTRSSIRRARI